MNDWLGFLGLKGTTLLGGLAGALVSLKFIPGATLWQRSTNVIGGMVAAGYLAPLVGSEFNLPPSIYGGIAFLIGMYGMQLADGLYAQIPSVISSVKERYFGKGGSL